MSVMYNSYNAFATSTLTIRMNTIIVLARSVFRIVSELRRIHSYLCRGSSNYFENGTRSIVFDRSTTVTIYVRHRLKRRYGRRHCKIISYSL